jgi:hypothetical protein
MQMLSWWLFLVVDEGCTKKLLKAQCPSAERIFEGCYLDPMHIHICFSCLSKMEFHLLPPWFQGGEGQNPKLGVIMNRMYTCLPTFLDRFLISHLFWKEILLAQGWRELV